MSWEKTPTTEYQIWSPCWGGPDFITLLAWCKCPITDWSLCFEQDLRPSHDSSNDSKCVSLSPGKLISIRMVLIIKPRNSSLVACPATFATIIGGTPSSLQSLSQFQQLLTRVWVGVSCEEEIIKIVDDEFHLAIALAIYCPLSHCSEQLGCWPQTKGETAYTLVPPHSYR